MVTTQSAKTTIFYTAYAGDQVPIYNGTSWAMTPITSGEISAATTDTTKSPAAIGASKVNDWFVWNDAGTIRIGHGPDWTSDTARSAGTALVMVNGILLNNASLTNGPAAQRGTYVGTTRSNGSSQLDWIYGTVASGGTAGFFGVWNMYNRRRVGSSCGDNTNSWTYNSATVRAANAKTTMRHSFVSGVEEDSFIGTYYVAGGPDVITALAGIGYDVTNAFSGISGSSNLAGIVALIGTFSTTALGFHFMQACEAADQTSANVATYIGDNGNANLYKTGLTIEGLM
jgi:hypothetical protein